MNQAVQTVIPPRPQAEGYTEFREVVKSGTIGAVLAHPEMKQRLVQAMPKHMSPERMLRVLALAIQKTPKLAQCNVASLLGAIMVCATLGLEPNTPLGHAYLIPFEKRKQVGGKWVTDFVEVNLILGYKGLIDLARRSGSLTSIHADVVYPGDTFEFEYGTGQKLRHIPTGDRTQQPTWAYSYAQLTDGHAFTVLPWAEVIKIRNASQGYQAALKARDSKEDWKKKGYDASPWVAHLHAMAAKTALRNLAKYLPMSIEFASAAALDEMVEVGKADLSYASLMTSVEDMVDATAIEDQSGEQQPADFVEQGMQQQAAQQQQPAETAQQNQEPAQQTPPKQRRQRQAADPPKPPPPDAEQRGPAKSAGELQARMHDDKVAMLEAERAGRAKSSDIDLTCMPFTAEVVDFDGQPTQFELPGDIAKFEAAFLAAMDVAAKAGQLKGFIDTHQQAVDDMKQDTPNLLARLEAKYGEYVAAVQQRQQAAPEPEPDPRDEPPPDEDDGPAQESFV